MTNRVLNKTALCGSKLLDLEPTREATPHLLLQRPLLSRRVSLLQALCLQQTLSLLFPSHLPKSAFHLQSPSWIPDRTQHYINSCLHPSRHAINNQHWFSLSPVLHICIKLSKLRPIISRHFEDAPACLTGVTRISSQSLQHRCPRSPQHPFIRQPSLFSPVRVPHVQCLRQVVQIKVLRH